MTADFATPPTATSAAPPETDPTLAPNQLRLVSILVSALPMEIGTPDEPARYTVPAVFSRQVTALEKARIEDPATARGLAPYADADLVLAVSDRRLLIENTTLAQLQGGLAAALASALREIDQELGVEQAQRTAEAEVRDTVERDREAAVAAAAAAIHFD